MFEYRVFTHSLTHSLTRPHPLPTALNTYPHIPYHLLGCENSHPHLLSTAIGKRITPRVETRATPGNHHYCFVDFSTADEADRAMRELNGKEIEGGALRVSMPRSRGPAFEQSGNNGWRNSPDSGSRQSNQSTYGRRPQQEGAPQEGQERPERREPTEKQRTIMTSNNWRSSAAGN